MVNTIINGCNGTMGHTLINTISSTEEFKVAAGVDPYGEASTGWGFPVYKSLNDVKEEADVVIDFSRADGLVEILSVAKTKKLPIVVATTGLSEKHLEYMTECSKVIPILQAANMSLGINLLTVLVKKTAAVLNNTFDIEIVEKHHNLKRDAPSGTALALANTLKASLDGPIEFVYGRKEKNKLRESKEIGIHSIRGGNIVGEHDVIFAGLDERLTLSHAAYSKSLFAIGAIQAAGYLVGKAPGFYHMDDVIAEKSIITHLYTSEEALVSFKNIPASLGTSQNIFKEFSDAGINIDMISQTATDEGFHNLSFTIENMDVETADNLLRDIRMRNPNLEVAFYKDLSKITVEGIGMETQSGVATAFFGILDELGVESRSITTSETKISIIIDKQFREQVTKLVKQRYHL